LALERRLGGEDACHRSDDGEPRAGLCQCNIWSGGDDPSL
jgi:hypothetical protein